MKIVINIRPIRPSDVVRSIEDGVVGSAVLIRGALRGLKRDIAIEAAARQLAKEHKRSAKMTEAQKVEAAADFQAVIRRADELIG